MPQSPHCPGCAGGPRPAPRGATCYSAHVHRQLMKPVPGELPHSWGERLINEASATAAGASARGTGTGTGSGRADGRTDRRTDGWLPGRVNRQPVPVLAEMLVRSRGWSRAGRPDPGSARRGQAETQHRGPTSMLPPTPLPLLLAPRCGLFLLSARAKPAPWHNLGMAARARRGPGWGLQRPPQGCRVSALARPNFPPNPLAGCIDFIFCFHGNCLLPFPLLAAGPAPSPSRSTQPQPAPTLHQGRRGHKL